MAEQVSDFIGKLSLTAKYSDLKLVCEGHEFNVHKVIVCMQSRVLSAACDGEFKVSLFSGHQLHLIKFTYNLNRRQPPTKYL